MSTNQHNLSALKLEALRPILAEARSLLIVMQDYPDPDALASAAALKALAHAFGEARTSLTSGGVIGRAENRALAEYLHLPLRRFEDVDWPRFDVIALVDTQPGTGNNALPHGVSPAVVLDHHPLFPNTQDCRFFDVRPHYGATSTIAYEYLVEAGVDIGGPLATALVYGIRSDTHDLGRDSSRADLEAMSALYPKANHRMLSEIRASKTPRTYFRMITSALQNAYVLGDCVVSDVGRIETPDIVGEIADLLLRDDQCRWSLCFGVFGDRILLSLRTSDWRASAGSVMRELVSGIGTGGGHRTMAGGQIRCAGDADATEARSQLEQRIETTLCDVLQIVDHEPMPFL